MNSVGQFFREQYPWVTVSNVNVYSTHRSRALESAWSLILGLLPGTPVKFETIKSYEGCDGEVCCGGQVCCIRYYHRGDDLIFGQGDPSMAYKLNINSSELLRSLAEDERVSGLISRLQSQGAFRIRRDPLTTVSKLKDIHSQLGIDAQLGLPSAGTLVGKYGLSVTECDLVRLIGNEVISRRLVPASDLVVDTTYNEDQGRGIIRTIAGLLRTWAGSNEFHVFSCHDTNLIAVMALLGIKIDCPEFAGYLFIERTADTISFYYRMDPFEGELGRPKAWVPMAERDQFINWDDISEGVWGPEEFMGMWESSSG